MIFVTAMWIMQRNETYLKLLKTLSQSLFYKNEKIIFYILILEGIHYITLDEKKQLSNLGFNIIDCSAEFSTIKNKFKGIVDYYSHYETNCFLRWIVFKDLFLKVKFTQFWHFDIDLYFHVSIDDIIANTRNKTFVLQGCPAFVSISDFKWFEQYEYNLSELNKNIYEYSKNAFLEKDSCKNNDHFLCNYSAYRNPLGSDQDLIQYLISSKRIIQNNAPDIFNGNLFYYQNGLEITDWDDLQFIEKKVKRTVYEKDGELWYGEKKIAFTHITNSFIRYVNLFLLVKQKLLWMLPEKYQKKILNYNIIDTNVQLPLGKYFLNSRVIRKLGLIYSRSRLTNYILSRNKKTGNLNLIDILNFIITLEGEHVKKNN